MTTVVAPVASGTDINVHSQDTSVDCLKEVGHFFSTDYVNICTGQKTTVNDGGADIAASIGITIIGFSLVAIAVGMVGMVFKMLFDPNF